MGVRVGGAEVSWVGLGWEGKGREGLCWVGIGREGLGWDGMGGVGLGWEGRAWVELSGLGGMSWDGMRSEDGMRRRVKICEEM